jgi:hypothetical protein
LHIRAFKVPFPLYQERLGVLAAPRKVRSTFIIARLRSAVPKHA